MLVMLPDSLERLHWIFVDGNALIAPRCFTLLLCGYHTACCEGYVTECCLQCSFSMVIRLDGHSDEEGTSLLIMNMIVCHPDYLCLLERSLCLLELVQLLRFRAFARLSCVDFGIATTEAGEAVAHGDELMIVVCMRRWCDW
jgi:hypothetical protein